MAFFDDLFLTTFLLFGMVLCLAFLIPRHWWNGRLQRDQQVRITPELIIPAVPLAVEFQAQLIRELTHYHTPRMDALLQKLGPPITLTDTEMEELHQAILAREHDISSQISPDERDAARLLPIVIRRAQRELTAVAQGTIHVKLVLVPYITEGAP